MTPDINPVRINKHRIQNQISARVAPDITTTTGKVKRSVETQRL